MERGGNEAMRPHHAALLGLADALDWNLNSRDLRPNLSLKSFRHVRIGLQELLGLLPALAQSDLAIGEPGARLAHDVVRHANVEQTALAADPLAIHDVELGHAEGRCDLVLDHLDAHPAANGVRAALDR